jgi:hypothetical protein
MTMPKKPLKASDSKCIGMFAISQLESAPVELLSGQYLILDNEKGKQYKLSASLKGGRIYCTCASWKFQVLPASDRTCKHCQLINNGFSS